MPELSAGEASKVMAAIRSIEEHVRLPETSRVGAGIGEGSEREADRSSPVTDIGFDIAALKLSASEDHLAAVAQLMSAGVPRYACYTSLRAALEAAGAAYWLVDPKSGRLERQARSLTAQLQNVRSTDRAQNPKKGLRRSIADRERTFGEAAASLGIPQVKPGDKVEGFGEAPPGQSREVNRLPRHGLRPPDGFYRGGSAYSTLSAFAHGEMWAILLNRRVIGANSTHSVLELTVNVDWLVHFVAVAIHANDAVMDARMTLTTGAEDSWSKVQSGSR